MAKIINVAVMVLGKFVQNYFVLELVPEKKLCQVVSESKEIWNL